MIRIIKLSFILLCLTSCSQVKTDKQTIDQPEHIISIIPEPKQLFTIPAMNDTLKKFIESVDSIPGPYDLPKINLLQFEKKGKDTIFYLTVGTYLYQSMTDNDPRVLIGGCIVNGEYVAIYYSGIDSLKNIVNEELLSIEFIKKIDTSDDYDRPIWDWDYFCPSEWLFKLAGDSFITIKQFNHSDYLKKKDAGLIKYFFNNIVKSLFFR